MNNCSNILMLLVGVLFMSSCSKDLGTGPADYIDINELSVEGIDKLYARDMDDSLVIKPKLEGTLYSDTNRFTYAWDIDNTIVSENLELAIKVNMTPGSKMSRFIVEDKETKIRKYFAFDLNISSSTAGNLLMVLSKFQGQAELSYLRLDRPAEWAVNYYESRFGIPLGINPQRLGFIMAEPTSVTALANNSPFANQYGRILVQVDDKIALIDKGSLEPNDIPYLEGEAFTRLSSYPPPDISGYKPEFFTEAINIWRANAYGTGFQSMSSFQLISGGALYYATLAPSVWTPTFVYNRKSVYGTTGYFSPYGYFDTKIPTPDDHLFQHGFDNGYFIVFDRNFGRFAYSSYGTNYSIPTTDVKAFPGHDLVYGSHTSQSGTSFAVLKTASNVLRFLLLGREGTTFSLVGEVGGGMATDQSKFYNMNSSPYVFFTSGNKLYKYNILNATSNIPPNEGDAVLSLTSLGYDSDAVITSMTVSRTENTLLLGVSRYGADKEAMGEEIKGDVLRFDLNKTTLGLVLKEKYEGVAGIPVDVKIKYQTHWRNGRSNGGLTELDNI